MRPRGRRRRTHDTPRTRPSGSRHDDGEERARRDARRSPGRWCGAAVHFPNATIMALGDGKMHRCAPVHGWMCMLEPPAPRFASKEWPGCPTLVYKRSAGETVAWLTAQGDRAPATRFRSPRSRRPTSGWCPGRTCVADPDTAQLDTMPTDPNNGGPWVMWKGTKFAHIMVPTAPMPKTPPMKSAAPKPAEKK